MILFLDTIALVKKYFEGARYVFAWYDERLREAARAEGLETLPSSAPDRRV
jgi:hypothetical protein